MTIAIIGAGPVGLFAAFECGMMGYACTIFDRLPQVGGQCLLYPDKPIYDIPGFPQIYGKELIENLVTQAARFQPTYRLSTTIVDVATNTDGSLTITTDKSDRLPYEALIMAAGIGAFGPKKLPLQDIEAYENTSVLYHIENKAHLANKRILIAGGGDTAVDWTIALSSIASQVTMIHRRDAFRCHPGSHTEMRQLADAGAIHLKTPYQLHGIKGTSGNLHAVTIKHLETQAIIEIPCDILLPFFGLSADLGPLKKWPLLFQKNKIITDPETMTTNFPGIYAIGDISTYPGKLNLILAGFHEAAKAAWAIRAYLNPGKAFHFEFSTNMF